MIDDLIMDKPRIMLLSHAPHVFTTTSHPPFLTHLPRRTSTLVASPKTSSTSAHCSWLYIYAPTMMTHTCRFQPAHRHRPAHIAAMQYYSIAYHCTVIALETDGNSELDTRRDLRAKRARRPSPQDASVPSVQHLYNKYEERTSVDEYTVHEIYS
jgi:hypothetical protein